MTATALPNRKPGTRLRDASGLVTSVSAGAPFHCGFAAATGWELNAGDDDTFQEILRAIEVRAGLPILDDLELGWDSEQIQR